jgi:hypothetical protein
MRNRIPIVGQTIGKSRGRNKPIADRDRYFAAMKSRIDLATQYGKIA